MGGIIINCSRDTTEYIGNLIMKNSRPVMLLFDGGYATFNTSGAVDGCHYYIQDYMGNNRMVVNKNGTVEQVTHYYPYGGVIGDISTLLSDVTKGNNENMQKYKFEDKELDRTFGLDNYDIQARQYFALMPSWDKPDKNSEDYYLISPYSYCAGNPVNMGDYDGRKPTVEQAARMSKYMYGELDPDKIGGEWNLVYHLQEQSDGYTAALFSRVNQEGTEYAYAFRGTRISETNDWENNISQVAGTSTQYHKSMDDAMILNCRFKDNELTFVGHSKAGGQAAAAAYATGRKAVTLNAAGMSFATKVQATVLRIIGTIMGEVPLTAKPDIQAEVMLTDPLNILCAPIGLGANGDKHYKKPKSIRMIINGHSIDVFIETEE